MTISVFGCGWLGLPLAERLLSQKLTVRGSTTSEEKLKLLKQIGLKEYLIRLPDLFLTPENDSFWDADILFLNVPPSRNSKQTLTYPELLEPVISRMKRSSIQWILFASSTSVYPPMNGLTTEDHAKAGEAAKNSGNKILSAEELILSSGIDTTIIRFGGLYGYGRHPVKYLSGKKNLGDPLKPVNLIHQLDCLNIITEVISRNLRNETFNAVSDGHPPRKQFYEAAARYYNLPLPHFLKERKEGYSVISNEKLKKALSYEFRYPNPMDHTP